MGTELTACFVGLGSIGKRHLRNLTAIARELGIDLVIDALRHAPTPLSEDIAPLIRRQYRSADELSPYDLIFICNPSQLHYETLLALKDKGRHFFVEKPVFVTPLTDEQLVPFADETKFYVACPLRHTKVYRALQKFVAEHKIYSARAICSSYLPDWRPGAEYRKLYSASKDSGGVKIDLIHEFDYLFSLFGFPKESQLFEGHVSHLEIESSDVVSFVGRYPNMTLELHLDYFGRIPQRHIELYTADDIVNFDYLKSRIKFLKKGDVIELGEERNDFQIKELECFLDLAIGGGRNINSISYANGILRELVS